MCLADALPPAIAMSLRGFAPLSSMTWMVDFYADEARTDDGWWLLESRSDFATGGHSSQDMSIWNTGGQCVAKARQMVTVFA
jgi:acyl-CoA thioesterase